MATLFNDKPGQVHIHISIMLPPMMIKQDFVLKLLRSYHMTCFFLDICLFMMKHHFQSCPGHTTTYMIRFCFDHVLLKIEQQLYRTSSCSGNNSTGLVFPLDGRDHREWRSGVHWLHRLSFRSISTGTRILPCLKLRISFLVQSLMWITMPQNIQGIAKQYKP